MNNHLVLYRHKMVRNLSPYVFFFVCFCLRNLGLRFLLLTIDTLLNLQSPGGIRLHPKDPSRAGFYRVLP